MKTILALCALIAIGTLSAIAENLSFPNKDNTMFLITIPDNWNPEIDDDEALSATSPSEQVFLSGWELEDQKDIKTLIADIGEMFEENTRDFQMKKDPEMIEGAAMKVTFYEGTAQSKEDGEEIKIYASLLETGARAAVLMFEEHGEADEKDGASLEAMMASIKPVGAAAEDAEEDAEGPKLLRGALALDADTRPTDKFYADAEKIHAFYIGMALTKGDRVRGVWIAEDVGDAAPKNTVIDEATLVAETATDESAFSISKPTNGWPIGSYRVEIYVGDKLAETLPFTIGAAKD
jgi:hypothetical protein